MNRRTIEGYRLRVYMDAIRDTQAMTDSEWTDAWVSVADAESLWIPRDVWLAYLVGCAMVEADRMTVEYKEAA